MSVNHSSFGAVAVKSRSTRSSGTGGPGFRFRPRFLEKRVSTLDQNEKRQLDGQALDRVFTDKASGRDTSRPELTELLRFARDGDTVVVHSMDRLARNLDDLRALVLGLTRKGVRVELDRKSVV